MDKADENVTKFIPVSVIGFFMESHAEASWVGCDVGADELEGVKPSGCVIESLGASEMFGADGHIDGYRGIVMMFFVMFF